MSQYSLVIQGPIISKGITGKTHIDYKLERPFEVKAFNCVETIQTTLRDFAHLFREIVVAVWEGDPIEEADIAFCDHCKLLKIKPLEVTFAREERPTGEVNMLKQFVSTRDGILALRPSADDEEHYVIKLRTDQWVNLTQLIEEHQAATATDRAEKIFLVCYTKHKIGDFYFAARKDVLRNFCNAVVELLPEYPQMDIVQNSVHLVAPILYRLSLTNRAPEVADVIYLKSLDQTIYRFGQQYRNAHVLNEYIQFLDDHFDCFSRDLFLQTIWRGDQYIMAPNDDMDFEVKYDPNQMEGAELNAFNFFLYYSPKRYFEKGGNWSLKSILGALNWGGMQLLPFYRNWIIKRSQQR